MLSQMAISTGITAMTTQIYIVGRGPSATTVTSATDFVLLKATVINQGTVMDISSWYNAS